MAHDYFHECKDCMFREHNDKLIGCVVSRLGLAMRRLLFELPIINNYIRGYKFCELFIKEESNESI